MNMIDQWFDAMTRASVHAAWILGLVWVICRAAPAMPSHVRCWLWRVGYLKVLLAFFFAAQVEVPLLPAKAEGTAAHPVSRGVPEKPTKGAVAVEPPVNLPGPETFEEARTPWRGWLAAGWAMGLAMALLRLLQHQRAATALRREATRVKDTAILEENGRLANLLGLKEAPRLSESPAATVPTLVGSFRPEIIIPTALLNGPRIKLRMVLAHELGHVKRKDLRWNWLAAAIHGGLFFHPMIWLSKSEWRLSQEMACDELALALRTGTPSAYAELLLTASLGAFKPSPFSAGMLSSGKDLKRRIDVMKHVGNRSRGAVTGGYAFLMALVLMLFPFRIVADKAESAAPREGETGSQDPGAAEKNLLEAEAALAREHAELVREHAEAKLSPAADQLRAQQEVLRAERELAEANRDSSAIEQTYEEELKLLDRLVSKTESLVEAGNASREELYKLQIEKLRIERERLRDLQRQTATRQSAAAHPELGLQQLLPGAASPIEAIELKLIDLQAKEAELLTKMSRSHPSVRGVQAQAKRLHLILDELKAQEKAKERAERPTKLSSRRQGIVEKVLVSRGDRVSAGQELVRLDAREAESRLRIAEAQNDLANAKWQQEIKVQYTSPEKQRIRHAEARAEWVIADEQLKEAIRDVEMHTLRAPFDGVIMDVRVRPGETVTGSPDELLILMMERKSEPTDGGGQKGNSTGRR